MRMGYAFMNNERCYSTPSRIKSKDIYAVLDEVPLFSITT